MKYIAEDELLQLSLPTREEIDKILDRMANQLVEKIYCSIPNLLLHLTARQAAMDSLYTKLFEEIPEAVDDREALANVIQKLEAENPGLSPEDLFKLVPAEYRNLKKVTAIALDPAQQNGFI